MAIQLTTRSCDGLRLFARSRGWLAVSAGVVFLAVASWWVAAWLASFQGFWYPEARVPVIAAAPLIAAILIGRTLDSPDVDLDESSPLRWTAVRAVNVAGWTTLSVVTLAVTAITDPWLFGSGALVRNVLGYVGLTCVGVVLLGAKLSWLPGVALAFPLYLAAPRLPSAFDRWWAWPMQDGTWDGSWVVASAWFLCGLALYAQRGPKPLPIT